MTYKKSRSELKYIIILALLILQILISNNFFIKPNNTADTVNATGVATQNNNSDIEQNINDNIFRQLSNLDFSELEKVIAGLDSSYSIFGNGSFKDKIIQIVNGTYFTSFNNVFSAVINLVFDGLVEILPILLSIIAIAILSALVSNFRSSSSNNGVNDIIHFVCYAVIILLIVTSFTQIMKQSLDTLNAMTSLMEITFPILLTLLTGIGVVSSVSIYKPIVTILTSGVSFIFSTFLYPLFILAFIFTLISNLSSTVKLNKFSDFISSLFKWVIGFILTIFSSFLVIQGISAGKFDSVSIKATKFAVKSYIPIIGGFISEGFDFIILSSVLIKNAIGVGVLFLIFISILVPVIKIVVFKLGLQLVSAIIEPIGNSRITNFINGCSKILIYPIVILLGVAFMFLLTVALIMSTANIF